MCIVGILILLNILYLYFFYLLLNNEGGNGILITLKYIIEFLYNI